MRQRQTHAPLRPFIHLTVYAVKSIVRLVAVMVEVEGTKNLRSGSWH